jgi:hypothetical protein
MLPQMPDVPYGSGMRGARLAVITLSLVLSGGACSNTSTATTPSLPDTSALVKQILSHCTDLAAPELGDGVLCIDNGFRMKTDDFSFKNWGRSLSAEGNVTAQTLIDLFGHDSVCVAGPKDTCILRPTAIQKLEEWNTALNGGRCEGLAALSTRFLLRMDSPSTFQSNATSVSALSQDNEKLNSSVVYWWATQFLNEVTDHAATSRGLSPLRLVDDLIQGIAHSVGYTVGIYNGPSGHSLTPFAVTQRGDEFVIHVYDNNHPGERFELFVNSQTNQWRYPRAFRKVDGSFNTWSGGTGTLELTAMSTRKGPFQCSFCNTALTNAPHVITLASRDNRASGFIEITTKNGVLRTTPSAIENSIAGATVSIGKGNSSGLVTISLPSTLQQFDVRLIRNSQDVPAADVVLGLRRSDGASIQVTGNLAHDVLSEKKRSSALISVTSDETAVRAPQENIARLSLSAGSHISRRVLTAGETMTVKPISANSIEVSLKGANGSSTPFVPIDLTAQSATTELTISLNDNGQLTFLPSRIAPIRVAATTPLNFSPGKANQTTSTTVPSIEISEPD